MERAVRTWLAAVRFAFAPGEGDDQGPLGLIERSARFS